MQKKLEKKLTLSKFKPFVSKSEARVEIQHVEVKNGRATATDSFVLVDVPFAHNGTVPIADGLYNPKTAEVLADTSKHFPLWKNVVPTGEPKFRVSVNGEYLAKVAKLLASQSAIDQIELEFHGAGAPIVMRGKRVGEESLGLVMPMRG